MTRFATRLMFTLLTTSSVAIVAMGCEKKPPPAPVEAPPPPPAPSDTAPVDLKPLDDAPDASDAAAAAKPRGNYAPVNQNAVRIRQCCNALRNKAKTLGTAPEAAYVMGAAVQCDMFAAQIGGGTAPEFAQIRAMSRGRRSRPPARACSRAGPAGQPQPFLRFSRAKSQLTRLEERLDVLGAGVAESM